MGSSIMPASLVVLYSVLSPQPWREEGVLEILLSRVESPFALRDPTKAESPDLSSTCSFHSVWDSVGCEQSLPFSSLKRWISSAFYFCGLFRCPFLLSECTREASVSCRLGGRERVGTFWKCSVLLIAEGKKKEADKKQEVRETSVAVNLYLVRSWGHSVRVLS